MAQQQIGVGAVANDNTGDPIRDAFVKVNDNFDEAYATGIIDSNLVTPGNEDTPTSANLNGLTTSVNDADITIKANGTGQIIFDTDTIRISSTKTPASSKGVAGDTIGDITFDADWIYICQETYTVGGIDIWAQVPAAVSTF